MSILMGPILRLIEADANRWKVSALVALLDEEAPSFKCTSELGTDVIQIGKTVLLKQADNTAGTCRIYRATVDCQRTKRDYAVHYAWARGEEHEFVVPGAGSSPKFAYASCNGFSDPKLMKKVADKNALWVDLMKRHEGKKRETGQPRRPYHAMLLGGDQVYSDTIWEVVPEIKRWVELPRAKRLAAPFDAAMRRAVDQFYLELYLTRWSQREPAAAMASIPTAMMWDDHDIFDGWGSYPEEQLECDVFEGIFDIARTWFQVFQLHAKQGTQPEAAIPGQEHFNYAFDMGAMAVLALDMRSERNNDRVLSLTSWSAVFDWMDALAKREIPPKHLLVLSSIPVVHPGFGLIEGVLGALPGQQELEDDLRDHWTSRPHIEERVRLVHRLLNFAGKSRCRVTLLSGDVHVGALGAIESERGPYGSNALVINQLTSSGIVHPAPPAIAMFFLETVAKSVSHIERGITATMYEFPGTSHRFIGARNWLSLEPDTQDRIWANWFVEGEAHSYTKVIHPVDRVVA